MSCEVTNHYYSGQGLVMLAPRDVNGNPEGFLPVGNVSDLKISITTSVLEHKEACTGQRGTDLRLTTETKAALAMTVENFDSQNLADALRGAKTTVAGATSTDVAIGCYPGRISSIGKVKLSTVSLTVDSVAMTAYVDDTTPWDYKTNTEAGSLKFNDGSVLAMDKLGVVVTNVAVGNPTVITVDNNLEVGDTVSFRGLTGADAATLNDLSFTVTVASATEISIDIDTTADTITTAADSYATWAGMPGLVTYTYTDQYQVDALTEGVQELYMRFEGLNTAESNDPVVVEVFKFSVDPLKELSLISDAIQEFVLEGSVLADNTRQTGSTFFKTMKTN